MAAEQRGDGTASCEWPLCIYTQRATDSPRRTPSMPRQQSEDEHRIRGQAFRSPGSPQGNPLERNSKLEDEEELDLIRCGYPPIDDGNTDPLFHRRYEDFSTVGKCIAHSLRITLTLSH